MTSSTRSTRSGSSSVAPVNASTVSFIGDGDVLAARRSRSSAVSPYACPCAAHGECAHAFGTHQCAVEHAHTVCLTPLCVRCTYCAVRAVVTVAACFSPAAPLDVTGSPADLAGLGARLLRFCSAVREDTLSRLRQPTPGSAPSPLSPLVAFFSSPNSSPDDVAMPTDEAARSFVAQDAASASSSSQGAVPAASSSSSSSSAFAATRSASPVTIVAGAQQMPPLPRPPFAVLSSSSDLFALLSSLSSCSRSSVFFLCELAAAVLWGDTAIRGPSDADLRAAMVGVRGTGLAIDKVQWRSYGRRGDIVLQPPSARRRVYVRVLPRSDATAAAVGNAPGGMRVQAHSIGAIVAGIMLSNHTLQSTASHLADVALFGALYDGNIGGERAVAGAMVHVPSPSTTSRYKAPVLSGVATGIRRYVGAFTGFFGVDHTSRLVGGQRLTFQSVVNAVELPMPRAGQLTGQPLLTDMLSVPSTKAAVSAAATLRSVRSLFGGLLPLVIVVAVDGTNDVIGGGRQGGLGMGGGMAVRLADCMNGMPVGRRISKLDFFGDGVNDEIGDGDVDWWPWVCDACLPGLTAGRPLELIVEVCTLHALNKASEKGSRVAFGPVPTRASEAGTAHSVYRLPLLLSALAKSYGLALAAAFEVPVWQLRLKMTDERWRYSQQYVMLVLSVLDKLVSIGDQSSSMLSDKVPRGQLLELQYHARRPMVQFMMIFVQSIDARLEALEFGLLRDGKHSLVVGAAIAFWQLQRRLSLLLGVRSRVAFVAGGALATLGAFIDSLPSDLQYCAADRQVLNDMAIAVGFVQPQTWTTSLVRELLYMIVAVSLERQLRSLVKYGAMSMLNLPVMAAVLASTGEEFNQRSGCEGLGTVLTEMRTAVAAAVATVKNEIPNERGVPSEPPDDASYVELPLRAQLNQVKMRLDERLTELCKVRQTPGDGAGSVWAAGIMSATAVGDYVAFAFDITHEPTLMVARGLTVVRFDDTDTEYYPFWLRTVRSSPLTTERNESGNGWLTEYLDRSKRTTFNQLDLSLAVSYDLLCRLIDMYTRGD